MHLKKNILTDLLIRRGCFFKHPYLVNTSTNLRPTLHRPKTTDNLSYPIPKHITTQSVIWFITNKAVQDSNSKTISTSSLYKSFRLSGKKTNAITSVHEQWKTVLCTSNRGLTIRWCCKFDSAFRDPKRRNLSTIIFINIKIEVQFPQTLEENALK